MSEKDSDEFSIHLFKEKVHLTTGQAKRFKKLLKSRRTNGFRN